MRVNLYSILFSFQSLAKDFVSSLLARSFHHACSTEASRRRHLGAQR